MYDSFFFPVSHSIFLSVMQCLKRGSRSSLWLCEDGTSRARLYHDTQRWSDGVTRDHSTYRGAGWTTTLPAPYLSKAFARLLQSQPSTVEEFADLCGIRPNTAWSYLCQLVEFWPREAAPLSEGFVYPPLMALVHDQRSRLKGSLREVMDAVVQPVLAGDVEWKCTHNRYAHLRLARLIADTKPRDASAEA